MAAITPFIEADTEPEEVAAGGAPDPYGFGATPASEKSLVEASLAGLTRLAWNRALIEDHLRACSYWLEEKKGTVVIRIDKPLPLDARPWKRISPHANADAFEIFSVGNSKMATLSWDLPAGPPSMGGTCPGATAAQAHVPVKARLAHLSADRRHLRVLPPGAAEPLPYSEVRAICAYCVTGDTRVLVRGRGLLRIENLVEAGEVEVWSGLGWRKTRAVFNGDKPVVEVTTTWGSRIRVTEDHKLFTLRRAVGMPYRTAIATPERADVLEEGCALAWQPPTEAGFASEASLTRRPEAPAAGEKRYKTANTENFPHAWSREVGLVLGALRGDGSINHETAQVTLGKGIRDADFIREISSLVNAWAGSTAAVHTDETVARSAWRNRGLLEFLEDCGADHRPPPDQRRVPRGIWQASDAAVRGFLSGLFTTDGCVEVNEQRQRVCLSLASVARVMLEEVQQLLFVYGIRSNLTEYRDGRAEQGYFRLWKLSISSHASVVAFAQRIEFASAWKKARLTDALASFPRRHMEETFPKVASVSDSLGVEPVYDLVNVGEEHHFYANGFTAGNCYASEGRYDYGEIQAATIVRYWWTREWLGDPTLAEEWVKTMTRGVLRSPFPLQECQYSDTLIRPVRVHSSGDFFSARYAEAWMEVANRVAKEDPKFRFWAPTRTWAAPSGFDWPAILAKNTAKNFTVRPSAYHVGDAAPGELASGGGQGSTSLIAPLTGKPSNFQATFPDAIWQGEQDPRRTFDCKAYAVGSDGSCSGARCRVCWTRPDLSVNYTFH